MDKKAWIAVILSVIGLFGWQMYLAFRYPPAPVARAAALPSASPQPSPLVTAEEPDVVADRRNSAPPTPAPATEAVPEQVETVTTPQIELHFTNQGGGIAEAIPLGKQHIAENGVNISLGHAGHIPIGALSQQPGDDARLPYTLRREGNTVTAERTQPDGLKIAKEFVLDWQGDTSQIPIVRMKVTFTNTGAQPYKNAGYFLHAGAAAPIHAADQPRYTCFDWLTDGHFHTQAVTDFDAGHVPLIGIQTRTARSVITDSIGKAAWIAVKNQFYVTIISPLDAPTGQEPAASEIWAQRLDLPRTPEEIAKGTQALHGVDAALGLPGFQLAPGESATRNFQIYAGPKFYSRLERLGHDEQEVMDYGKFKIVSVTLLALMNTFKSWLGNYALAIIALTILVKAVLFPLQNKANKSMKRMSALAPKMTELREKYKDDPTKLQGETMRLYKEHGVNPIGGCLPMLIQMPIFFGFLYMLYPAAELRNASFLWVHDLSQPDTVGRIAGIPINVLPLLMIGTQFWQMSLTPKTGDPSQQKTMMFMPLIFGFFCYNFAAALALYYTMQGLLTVLQLYVTRNQPPPTLERGGTASPKGKGGPASQTSFGRRGGGVPRRLKT